jgi:hypothetical protein
MKHISLFSIKTPFALPYDEAIIRLLFLKVCRAVLHISYALVFLNGYDISFLTSFSLKGVCLVSLI